MIYKTSEIIIALQNAVARHGDLPFEVCDADNGVHFSDVTVYANTVENGGCCDEDDEPMIGIQF